MAAQSAKPSSVKATWLIGTALLFTIFAFIAGYSQRMTYVYTGYDQQRAKDRLQTLAKLQADENKELSTLDWIDQGKQTVRIPIDTAMDKEIATLLLKPSAVGAALPVAAPAPASTNAAPAAPVPATAAPSTNAAPEAPTVPSTNAAPAKPQAPAKAKP